MNLQSTGTVISSGCVNGSYKGRTTYDCSVDIEGDDGQIERRIIKFGVLPDDQLGKWCGQRLWNRYECRVGRIEQ